MDPGRAPRRCVSSHPISVPTRLNLTNLVIPIPGCRSTSRVQENAGAAYIKLEDEDIKAIREMVDALQAHGDRYPEAYSKDVGGDTLSLKEWKGE